MILLFMASFAGERVPEDSADIEKIDIVFDSDKKRDKCFSAICFCLLIY